MVFVTDQRFSGRRCALSPELKLVFWIKDDVGNFMPHGKRFLDSCEGAFATGKDSTLLLRPKNFVPCEIDVVCFK